MNIRVTPATQRPLSEQPFEIVERKGLGHPDNICDSIAEEASHSLDRYYQKYFGEVAHYNLDKALLCAGQSKVRFGGGSILFPMTMIFGDRATFEIADKEVPVEEIVTGSAKKWFEDNFRFVDPEHVKYQLEIGEGSASLQRTFKAHGANDTSAAVGYAPLTRTEKLVLDTEDYVNSPDFKMGFPETGEDVKVMAFREGKTTYLTLAIAFVDRFIRHEHDYFRKRDEVAEAVLKRFETFDPEAKIVVSVNPDSVPHTGIDGTYLTVLGTSADNGDSGQVGRGNMANGIIPLNRPTCSEAYAGKNHRTHVGSIYNALSYSLAQKAYKQVSGVDEVYVWLLSQIGTPVQLPKICWVQVASESPDAIKKVKDVVETEFNEAMGALSI